MKTIPFSTLLFTCLLTFSCQKEDSKNTQTITLQNDGYVEQGNRAFIGTPVAGEEVAVTLGPVSNTFQVTFVTLLFGGTGQMQATRDVILKIYRDNGTVVPGDLLYDGDFTLPSSNSLLYQLDLRDKYIVHQGGGSIRISFELVDDKIFPSFAQEYDGPYDSNKNWIKDPGGFWTSNAIGGTTGNWVIRAIVEEYL